MYIGLLVGAAAVAVVGVYLVFWPVSDLIATHDVGPIIGPHHAAALQQHAAALRTARDAARGRLLTFGAGLFALGALVYTGRNFALSRRTVELTEQGQVTERYTKAVEQLGSDKLDVRIGGIYALERIAHDSPRDHPTVMEVLAAFVREHSQEQWPPPSADEEPGADDPQRTMRPDVQAAVSVIRRRNPIDERQPIDLTNADLPGADLSSADLSSASLTEADLAGADLTGASLTEADLTGADLARASFIGADLTRAHLAFANLTQTVLAYADLTGASLVGAYLTEANLTEANLTQTVLAYADLTGASLVGADLAEADFTDADLTRAHWPPAAVVPQGWQRDTDSGRLKRADTDPGGAPTDAAPGT